MPVEAFKLAFSYIGIHAAARILRVVINRT
jgi:hypothetical protein